MRTKSQQNVTANGAAGDTIRVDGGSMAPSAAAAVSLSGACSAGAISGGSIVLHLRLPFRYRIRTYVVETPVQEQVRLRDERVIVEQRPASGGAPSGAGAMQNRDFEVTERHEEPVIEKRAREVEEVVVRREANERVETVRDTVRETKVDVDKEPADRRVGGTVPPNRNP